MIRSLPPRKGAFTLIELLTVMVIILILAALVLALVGYAQTKGSLSKAQGEIAAMSTALESYKTDNGTYPRLLTSTDTTPSACDSLDAKATDQPSGYIAACAILYRALSGDGSGDGKGINNVFGKTYYNVPASEIVNDKSVGNYITDPFGNCYGYSTAYQYNLEKNQSAQSSGSGSTPSTPTQGYNPTFDLWSTGGYSTSSKSYPSDLANNPPAEAALWVKNW